MKKTSLIFLFILFLFHCQGQNLLQEGKLWSNTSIGTMPGSNYSSYYIKFMGDTIINGMGYKKIMKSKDELHVDWSGFGYIREEATTGKVFVFDKFSQKDILLYDFSLNIGDSILIDKNLPYIKVTKVVYAPFGNSNEIRKQISFFDSNARPTWIEGIGGIGGILEGLNSYFSTGADKSLVCYYENDQLVYHNPNFSTCYPKGLYNNTEKVFRSYPALRLLMEQIMCYLHLRI